MVEPSQRPIKASDVPAFEHTPGGTVRFVHGYDHGVRTVTLAISDRSARW